MKNPRQIEKTDSWNYVLPVYEVTDEGIQDHVDGWDVRLCRGNKEDQSVPRQAGVFSESLLELVRQYLTDVNKDQLASRETSIAITKIDEALMWLNKRAEDRKLRGVQATYLK